MNNPYLKAPQMADPPSERRVNNKSLDTSTTSTATGCMPSVVERPSRHQSPLVTPPNNTVVSHSASALIISASAKAGMEGIDRARIDAIILRESGDSKFMQQQRQRDDKVNDRIATLRNRLRTASPQDYAVVSEVLDERLQQWQASQATRSTCVVVDMDMFYFACETLEKPHLRSVPACVGNGMILTSNYPARRFGVRSAMPGWIGDKLVEELTQGKQRLIHVPSNFELYKQKSVQVVDVLKQFDPNLRSYSLDEAYLDLGPYLALYLQQKRPPNGTNGSSLAVPSTAENTSEYLCDWDHSAIVSTLQEQKEATTSPRDYCPVIHAVSSYTCRRALEQIVRFMRSRVEKDTGGLTCSAGMAPNFSLAKIASDFNKPNGQCFVDPSQVLEFVRPLPVRKIPGIGRVTEKVLNAFDIITVQDLYDHRGLVNWMFQPATREFLLRASVGCMGSSSSSSTEDLEDDPGNNNSNEPDHQKGISRERTFQANDCWTTLNCKLEDVARMLSEDMIRKKVLAHTVTVKVKLATFNVYSRSKSLKRGVYIQTHHELIAVAASLMAQIRSDHFATFLKNGKKNSFSCRLLGIRCSNLVEEDEVSNSQKESIEKFLSKSSSPAQTTTCTRTSTSCGDPSETIHTQSVVTGPPQRKILEFPTKEALPWSNNQMVSCSPAVGVYEANDPPSKTNIIMAQAVSPEEHVACPLCRRKFPLADNSALNQHIDSCLSGSTVRQAVRECKDPSKKRQRLTDWWIK